MRRTTLAGVTLALLAAPSLVTLGGGTAAAKATDLRAVDRAGVVGLRAPAAQTYSATSVDYNRDGRQDIWIGHHGRPSKLWKNRGDGTYRRVAKAAWPTFTRRSGKIDRHDCAWADVDRNGLLDAYCSTGRMLANVVKGARGNELWLQRRPGKFREVGARWGVRDVCARGRHIAFFDANGDRYPDIFLGNDVPRADPDDPCNAAGNRLPNERSKVFLNARGTGFRYVRGGWSLPAGAGTLCAIRLDFDRDGWDDVLACGGFDEAPRLYRNRRGRGFADVSARNRLRHPVTGATVSDLDRDGDVDVVTASPEGFAYYPNLGRRLGARRWVGRVATGEGHKVAVADVDRDGDQDVYGLVKQGRRDNPDDAVWINRRQTFTPIPVPSAAGVGGDVVALSPRAGRRPGFLVLNGYGPFDNGPVQFIQVVGGRTNR
jgi:hypothetical protein